MGLEVTLHLLIGKAQSPSQANTQRNQPRPSYWYHFCSLLPKKFLEIKFENVVFCWSGNDWPDLPQLKLDRQVTRRPAFWSKWSHITTSQDSRNKCSIIIYVVLKTNVPICVRVCLTPEKNFIGLVTFFNQSQLSASHGKSNLFHLFSHYQI